MDVKRLRGFNLVYVATPYSNYKGGLDAAFAAANKLACDLIVRGINVFCPITHSHPLCRCEGGYLDPVNAELWERVDASFVAVADVLLVGMLEGWERSRGVNGEIKAFKRLGKPQYFIDPHTLLIVQAPVSVSP